MRQILAAEPALARWIDRQQREHAVLQQVKRALPPALAAHVEAADAESQQLVLAAASGAAAALLRQRAPALLQTLAREGCKFTVIKVRVQPRSAARPAGKSISKQIDAVSAEKLRARALALADPSLREALLRLAERAATRRSGEKQALAGVDQERGHEKEDGVLDDLPDEPEVPAVAPEQVENRRARNRGKGDEQ